MRVSKICDTSNNTGEIPHASLSIAVTSVSRLHVRDEEEPVKWCEFDTFKHTVDLIISPLSVNNAVITHDLLFRWLPQQSRIMFTDAAPQLLTSR